MQCIPVVIGPLDPQTRQALMARYEGATNAETRLRYQVIWVSSEMGLTSGQIAALVLRSHDTVLRVLKRFQDGGLDAVPRRHSPGRPRTVTPEWEAELGRVIDLDPRSLDVPSANWTLELLTGYLKKQTNVSVDQETTRRHLRRLGYVCKRPRMSLQDKAAEQSGYVGKGCGWRSS